MWRWLGVANAQRAAEAGRDAGNRDERRRGPRVVAATTVPVAQA